MYKLSLFLGFGYYSFFPTHLLGGLILAGPIWNYQIGTIDNFEKRKPWTAIIILIVPVLLFLYLATHYPKNKSITNFEAATKTAISEQEKVFVLRDSTAIFFDIQLPIMASSYIFKTEVEDITTFYNIKDFEEGRFGLICCRTIADNEAFNLSSMTKNYTTSSTKALNNNNFKSFSGVDYIKNPTDTIPIRGTLAYIKINKFGYMLTTQYSGLNKDSSNNLSYHLLNNIKPIANKIR